MITDWTIINKYEERINCSASAVDEMDRDVKRGVIDVGTDAGQSAIEYIKDRVVETDRFICGVIFN